MKGSQRPYKILFLCTGNSARSIMAEYLMRKIGRGRFEAHSAGTQPAARVNLYTLRTLRDLYGIDASKAHSKSLKEIEDVEFDFVVTVCDKAREDCPSLFGQPVVAHWAVADPARARGTDQQVFTKFQEAAKRLQRLIEQFCALSFEPFDRMKLTRAVQDMEGIEDAGTESAG